MEQSPPTAPHPAWVRELDMALPIYPQIVLTGNIRDEYHLPSERDPARTAVLDLEGLLKRLTTRHGYAALARHDLVTDTTPTTRLHPDAAPPQALEAPAHPAAGGIDFTRLRRILTDLTANHTAPPTALLVESAGRLTTAGEHQPEAARLFFAAADLLAHRARTPIAHEREQPYNTILWATERLEDLPASFTVGNPRIRVIDVPHPQAHTRLPAARRAVRILLSRRPEPEATDAHHSAAAQRLAAATHGMQARQIAAIGRLAADQDIGLERIEDAARLYRVGITDNPWRDPQVLHRIRQGEERLNARVRGQRAAVRKTMEIFMRSATGLTGAHATSTPNRPRGVLFLAGPTGVGKTELAKGIAELILGTDAQPIRFDMSEFASEHARDRLIGAPPGYVGFDAGGELTNAVRADPISVLLFDEIDKANPALFDLFLQILEDGRLTDGRGSVVHFTECVLLFTSNLGVAGPHGTLSRTDDPARVRQSLRAAFEEFFNRGIGRPELLNRFGDGFVALDFITDDVAEEILTTMLDNVAARIRRLYQSDLAIAEPARDRLRAAARDHLHHGGRGIGTAVESLLTNPLSRALFAEAPPPRTTLTVTDITHDGVGWSAHLDRA